MLKVDLDPTEQTQQEEKPLEIASRIEWSVRTRHWYCANVFYPERKDPKAILVGRISIDPTVYVINYPDAEPMNTETLYDAIQLVLSTSFNYTESQDPSPSYISQLVTELTEISGKRIR